MCVNILMNDSFLENGFDKFDYKNFSYLNLNKKHFSLRKPTYPLRLIELGLHIQDHISI